MTYWAHTRESDDERQLLKDHLECVAEKAAKAASAFGAEEFGRLAGTLHDIGKYSKSFQKRLDGSTIRVDHAAAGAQLAYSMRPSQVSVALAVAGHHGGLPDFGGRADVPGAGTFVGRLKKGVDSPDPTWKQEVNVPVLMDSMPFRPDGNSWVHAQTMFFARMLYSCLVDGDYLDTEEFVEGAQRSAGLLLRPRELASKLDRYLDQLGCGIDANSKALKCQRDIVLEACRKAATQPPGVFTLTVPTGGGKTLASLEFALQHAAEYAKERIIYVAPFISIIDQTADVYKSILGENAVLEHHHGVFADEATLTGDVSQECDKTPDRRIAENWDAPVIVTTAVQFFESLFAARPSRCRKIHNIANSIVILDEAHTLPQPYLEACVFALGELAQHYRTTIVLTTATQPALDELFSRGPAGTELREICPAEALDKDVFARSRLVRDAEMTDEELAATLGGEEQVLCIVNRRRTAQRLFKQGEARGQDGWFHLSTLMTPDHRKQKLADIRQRLASGLPCRVVSTSLIEAGVDVDFPSVYRELAPLDSLIQSAGRCNREGRKQEGGDVHVFRLAGEKLPRDFEGPVAVTQMILEEYDDCFSQEAITRYFQEWRKALGTKACDARDVMKMTKGIGQMLPFRTVADRFRLIPDETRPVYVPSLSCRKEIERLRQGQRNRDLFRRLDAHQVALYPGDIATLARAGRIELLDDGALGILLNEDHSEVYSDQIGLQLQDIDGQDYYI